MTLLSHLSSLKHYLEVSQQVFASMTSEQFQPNLGKTHGILFSVSYQFFILPNKVRDSLQQLRKRSSSLSPGHSLCSLHRTVHGGKQLFSLSPLLSQNTWVKKDSLSLSLVLLILFRQLQLGGLAGLRKHKWLADSSQDEKINILS